MREADDVAGRAMRQRWRTFQPDFQQVIKNSASHHRATLAIAKLEMRLRETSLERMHETHSVGAGGKACLVYLDLVGKALRRARPRLLTQLELSS